MRRGQGIPFIVHLRLQFCKVILKSFFFFFADSPIEYEQFLIRSIWTIDESLIGTITQGSVCHGSNRTKGLLHTS